MRVGPFAFRYQGNRATPCQYIDTTQKAIDCATTLPPTKNTTLYRTEAARARIWCLRTMPNSAHLFQVWYNVAKLYANEPRFRQTPLKVKNVIDSLHVVHSDLATLDHVHKSSRCRDQQVTAARQVLHLRADVGAAVHDARAHVRPVRELYTHTTASTIQHRDDNVQRHCNVPHV